MFVKTPKSIDKSRGFGILGGGKTCQQNVIHYKKLLKQINKSENVEEIELCQILQVCS